ncbi:MAG: uL14 family ribosomal protein [bacterium]
MTEEGYFVKGSARSVKPTRVEYKGFKFKYNVKGDICRGLILRTRFPNHKFDGSVLYFHQNSCILIKKKQNAKSKYLFGAISHKVRRKKFKTLFKLIL